MEWALITLGVYALFGIGVYTPIVNTLMFHPPESTYARNDNFLELTTELGDTITAMYLKNPEAKYHLLYAHGNAEDIEYVNWLVKDLVEFGLSVLVYEYPGYGYSSGKPTEQGAYAAATAAYDYLIAQGVNKRHIIGYGRSIGGGVATELALRRKLAGLILESTFVSTAQVITRLPLYPNPPFHNLDKIDKINTPLLIIHGTEDNLIDDWHGRKLYEKALAPKKALWVEGANHNDVYETDHRSYKAAVMGFIESLQ